MESAISDLNKQHLLRLYHIQAKDSEPAGHKSDSCAGNAVQFV